MQTTEGETMKAISGNLEMLGNAKLVNEQARYSVIEIGDHVLKKIFVPNGLDNFLQKGLGSSITIWIDGNVLWGVQFQNGKSYISGERTNPLRVFILFIAGLILLPVFGLGLFFIWVASKMFGNNMAQKNIRAKLPNAIPV